MENRTFVGDPHIHTDQAASGEYPLYCPHEIPRLMKQCALDFVFTTSHSDLPSHTAARAADYNREYYGIENGNDALIHPTIEYTLLAGRSKFHAALIPHDMENHPKIPKEMKLSDLETFIASNPRWSSFLYHAGLSSFMGDTHEDDIALVLESKAIHGMEVFNGVLMSEDYPIQRSSQPLHVLEQVEAASVKQFAYIGGSDARFFQNADREVGGVLMEVRANSAACIPEALLNKVSSKVVVNPQKYRANKLDELRRQAPMIDDYVEFRSSL